MFGLEILDLKKENGRGFYYDKIRIQKLKKEIEDFIAEEPFLDDFNFMRKLLSSLEIRPQNESEGFFSDTSNMEERIKARIGYGKDKNQIMNLYYGYRYILRHHDINKDTLKKLYSILSKNSLDEISQNNMGEYYRNGDVLIMDNPSSMYLSTYEKGLSPEKIETYMDALFQFINEESSNESLDAFIISQIIHFYFFYIHPYYDVNSRTASTVSLWYLLQQEAYPFVIFNRGISKYRSQYHKSVKKSRKGNITPFLKYLLITLKEELEKEKIMYNISADYGSSLSEEEYEFLEYMLSIKSHKLSDIIAIYERNNYPINKQIILLEKIYPLIEKGIVILNEADQTLKINKKFITINKRKVGKLRIKSYIAE